MSRNNNDATAPKQSIPRWDQWLLSPPRCFVRPMRNVVLVPPVAPCPQEILGRLHDADCSTCESDGDGSGPQVGCVPSVLASQAAAESSELVLERTSMGE